MKVFSFMGTFFISFKSKVELRRVEKCMKAFIEKVEQREHLTNQEMTIAAHKMLDEQTPEQEIMSFLVALAKKGETAQELAALAKTMKEHANEVQGVQSLAYLDNCGTGGDGLKSFNISTTAAFVLAACDVPIAKHGNRKVSSASGSTDLLEELGIPATMDLSKVSPLLKQEKLAFIFAPAAHPKLKRIGQIRSQLGTPTIFNLVGPLVNPVDLTYQLTGINRPDFVIPYAEVLKKLGRKRALVVSGEQGMDEASLCGETTCALLDEGEIISFTITAQELGLPEYPLEAIKGGTPVENARILEQLLLGKKDAYYDAVLFNAGLGLYAAGKVQTIQEGIHRANQAIEQGKAYEKLQAVRQYHQRLEMTK